MKLSIEIPKEFEADFNNDKFKDCFDRVMVDLKCGNNVLCGLYEYETLEMMYEAFSNAEVVR